MEKEKSIPRERLIDEQRKCQYLIQFEVNNYARQIFSVEKKCQSPIDHEMKKRVDFVKDMKDKSAIYKYRNSVTTYYYGPGQYDQWEISNC